MSSQKGNASRSRPQKYQNRHTFKNDMHDKSHQTKMINNIQVVNVCERCKKVIEWKIKYKKYKPLKAPAKCTKCEQKVIKHAYHIMCGRCALEHECCPKCGEKGEIVKEDAKEEPLKLDREMRLMLKKLPERKRRTFMRYMKGKGLFFKMVLVGCEKNCWNWSEFFGNFILLEIKFLVAGFQEILENSFLGIEYSINRFLGINFFGNSNFRN